MIWVVIEDGIHFSIILRKLNNIKYNRVFTNCRQVKELSIHVL